MVTVLVMPDPDLGVTGGVYGYPYAGTQGWTRAGMDRNADIAADGTVRTTIDAAARTSTGANGTMGTAGTHDLHNDPTQIERLQPFYLAILTG